MVRQSQAYSSTLQSYNTSLQNDVTAEKAKREEVVKQREELTAKVADLGGTCKSLERLLALEQVGEGVCVWGGGRGGYVCVAGGKRGLGLCWGRGK